MNPDWIIFSNYHILQLIGDAFHDKSWKVQDFKGTSEGAVVNQIMSEGPLVAPQMMVRGMEEGCGRSVLEPAYCCRWLWIYSHIEMVDLLYYWCDLCQACNCTLGVAMIAMDFGNGIVYVYILLLLYIYKHTIINNIYHISRYHDVSMVMGRVTR